MTNPRTILVVDDDVDILTAMSRLLTAHGFDCRTFSSVAELESSADFKQPVCMILDINLGRSSGIELGQRLKEAGISAPVIYMTGSDTPANREAAFKAGCVAFLVKPFAAPALLDALNKALT